MIFFQAPQSFFSESPKVKGFFYIEECDNLEYIFSKFLVQGLVSLESVRIVRKLKLKCVFDNEKKHNLAVYQSFQQITIKEGTPIMFPFVSCHFSIFNHISNYN